MPALLKIALARAIGMLAWSLNSPLWFRSRYARHGEALLGFAAVNPGSLGADPASRLARANGYFRHFYALNLRVQAAVALGDVVGARRVLRNAEVEGLEKISANLQRGVIGFSYHVGPFPLLPLFLWMNGYSVTILVRPDILLRRSRLTIEQINAGLGRFCDRGKLGRVSFVDAFSVFALMQLRKRLKKGELLFLYPDTVRESSAEHVPIPLFAAPIAGHPGPAKLFKMTGAAMLPFRIRWQPGGGLKISVHDPLPLTVAESDEAITQKIYGGLENDIREAPEQWIQVDSYGQLLA